MFRYAIVFLTLFTPVKASALQNFNQSRYSYSPILCMAPPGGTISNQANRFVTNRVNPPGCTRDTTTRNRSDGSVEERTTVVCTTVTVTRGGKQVSQQPAVGSRQAQNDSEMISSLERTRKKKGSSSQRK